MIVEGRGNKGEKEKEDSWECGAANYSADVSIWLGKTEVFESSWREALATSCQIMSWPGGGSYFLYCYSA